MGKIKRMDQIKMILQTYLATDKNIKATARRLQVSRNTVRNYVRKGLEHHPSVSKLLSLSEEELSKVFYAKTDQQQSNERAIYFKSQISYYFKELRRTGVTRHLLWEEYRLAQPEGYSYTQFCEHFKRAVKRRDVTMLLEHKAGEKLQLDFAGKGLYLTDPNTGEQTKCEVLVAVMPHSAYTYAVAIPSQKVDDFIIGINKVFHFLGCLPKVILSDNLKSYVTKANRYDPDFNALCVQLAAHYQIDLEAARVATPKDKASVENGVTNVYRKLYAPLRNDVFFNLYELNQALEAQAHLLNDRPFQKKSGTRREHFEAFEKPLMQSLPTEVFDIKRVTKGKVQSTYHVMLGAERNYYSVPFQYVGKQATIVYSATSVEIYIDNQRVATHSRLPGRLLYKQQTDLNHLPKNHKEWLETRGYTAKYFCDKAAKIGSATEWAIGQLMVGKTHEVIAYKSCEGALRLAKHYSPQRLEAACQRCRDHGGRVNYKMLENILKKNLDLIDEEEQLALDFSPPEHENIRGPEAYQ